MYLIVALIIAAFGLGFGSAWQLENKQIARLEAQIELSNHEASLLLRDATEKTEAATASAVLANLSLEAEHVKAMQLSSATRADLSPVRLRDPGQRKHCTSALSKSTDTGLATDSADSADLSKELSDFLKSESFRADTLANYANECYRFMINNCGLAR